MIKNIRGIVFDAYGTLFDVNSVQAKCDEIYPGEGERISSLWRQKQLEYSWLYSLMGRYTDFWKITDDALKFTLKELKLEATDQIRHSILDEYLMLKPYAEVPEAIRSLQSHEMAILSNGSSEMLHRVVENSGLSGFFKSVISVDDVRIFKPSMKVYELGPARLGIPKEEVLFISSNSWDASGAKAFGFKVCWINRFKRTFDELGLNPDLTISSLDELSDKLKH